MLSTECNLASSRARRLSVVLVFKIVLTSSKTSSAGHKFCSPENTTFIVVSLFLVSNTVQTSRNSSQFWFLSPENITFIVLPLVLVSKIVAKGLLQDSILVSNAQKMSNRAEVTFKIRSQRKQTGVMLLSFIFVIPLVRRGRDGGSRVWSNMWGQVVRSKKPGCRHRVRGRDYRAYYRAFTSSANFALLRTKMPVLIKFGVKRLIIRLKICILGKRCPPHFGQKIYMKEGSLQLPQV